MSAAASETIDGGAAPASGDGVVRRSGASSPDRLDLRSIVAIFRRRFRLFFYTALIVFEIAALFALWLPARYTATANIVLNTSEQAVTPTTQKSPADLPNRAEDIATEIQILTSRAMAAKVVDYLKLYDDPDIIAATRRPGLFARIFGSDEQATPAAPSAEDRARLRAALIGRLLGNLRVERLSTAFALSVSYTDPNPVRAAAIANAFAKLYTRDQLAAKQVRNRDAVRVLGARIERLREQAQTDFAALQRYRIANNLPSTTGASLTEQEISTFNQQVAGARAEAAEDRARLNTARAQLRNGSIGDDVGEALNSPVIQTLRAQRSALSVRVADLAGRYGPKNPDLLDALRQLADVDVQIQGEIGRIMSNLEAKVGVSGQRVASLQSSLNGARGSLEQNNRAMVELDDLQRRADTSQALYESYLNRYKEVVAAGGAERPDSRLVSDARIPMSPSFPKPMLILSLGLLLGLGLGVAAALIAETSFSGLTTGEEAEERLGVAYLGGVPLLKTVEPRGETPLETIRTLPRSPFSEAFRGVLATLRQGDADPRVLLVTSALPDEGKTTTTACLAGVAAQTGARVLVIDCDTVRRQFSTVIATVKPKQPGLRELLRGEAKLDAVIVKDAGAPGVDAIPITTAFADGERLIDRDLIQSLIAELRAVYDLILLDTAPVLAVAETRELSAAADRILLVAAWRKTPDRALTAAIKLIPPAARAQIGTVLTKVDMKRQVRFGYGDPTFFYRKYQKYYAA